MIGKLIHADPAPLFLLYSHHNPKRVKPEPNFNAINVLRHLTHKLTGYLRVLEYDTASTDRQISETMATPDQSSATNLEMMPAERNLRIADNTTDAVEQKVEEDVAVEGAESIHGDRMKDVVQVPSSRSFRPEELDLARARSLGYPTEETASEQSPTSSFSYTDLEKGIGSIVIKHQIGSEKVEVSDNPPAGLRSRPHLSRAQSWRISAPPWELAQLPSKRYWRTCRRLRHNLFAVYQRLFSIVFVGNTIAMVVFLAKSKGQPNTAHLASATAANVLVTVLIRQDSVVNALYAVCCCTPHSFPLRFRRLVAKVYEFGGVHSGSGICGTLWFIFYVAFTTRDALNGGPEQTGVLIVAYILLGLLMSICLLAMPHLRMRSHNTFEAVHRYAGWLAVGLFWVLVLLNVRVQSHLPGSDTYTMLVIRTPSFWMLLVITFCIILPWLRLRKVDVVTEKTSNHAIMMHFRYRSVGKVQGIRITNSPLKEWHPFATIPGPGKTFSIIVSDAGDWTKKQITEPPSRYWVRGLPVTGVLRMALVFKRVVIVTTGSGIGPTLSMLHAHPHPARILWSTPNPEQTYGKNILEAVGQADPEALIINTRATGRPDMVALAYHLYLESKAEAVFVLSNPSLTRKVVYGMESRSVPAFGPVWDS